MKAILLVPGVLVGATMGGCLPLALHAVSRAGHDRSVTISSDGDKITIETGDNGEQIVGSGPVGTETRSVESFHGVSVGSIIRLKYSTGPSTEVKLAGQPNVIPHVKMKVEDGILKINLEGNFQNIKPVTVTIMNPHLSYLEVSGAADADASGIKEDSLDIEVSGSAKAKVDGSARSLHTDVSGSSELSGSISAKDKVTAEISGNGKTMLSGEFGDSKIECSGASEIHLDQIKAENVELTSSGSSHVTLSGSTDHLQTECEGAGDADLSDLVAKTCDALASGAGRAKVNVKDSLTAEASGAGNIQYRGKPQVRQSTSGAAHVEALLPEG